MGYETSDRIENFRVVSQKTADAYNRAAGLVRPPVDVIRYNLSDEIQFGAAVAARMAADKKIAQEWRGDGYEPGSLQPSPDIVLSQMYESKRNGHVAVQLTFHGGILNQGDFQRRANGIESPSI